MTMNPPAPRPRVTAIEPPARNVRVLATESDGRQTCHPELLTLGAAQAELDIMRSVPSIVRIEIRQGSLDGPVVVGWSRAEPVPADVIAALQEIDAAGF